MTGSDEQQSPIRVLIVEDNEAQRQVLTDLIRDEGFLPVPCSNAFAALARAHEHRFGVAILDQRLPEMSGTSLLERLCAVQRGIQVIIHTAYGSFESAKDAVNLGAFAYVEKMGHPDVLVRELRRAAQAWMADALQRSEAKYKHLVDSIRAIVWRSDPFTGRFHFVSREAETLLGYPAEQWLAEPAFWQDHIHPDDRAWVLERCRHATATRQALAFEYRMMAADGRVVWLQDFVNIIVEAGQPVELVGVMIDITERKRLEKEILEISNREQRRIGQDLHDGLGQLLTGLGFRIAELEGDLRETALPLADDVAEMVQMVQHAIAMARMLAHGLDPVNVERQGLARALQELANTAGNVYGIACTFSCPTPVQVKDLEVASQAYRIAQEALNNALKHGRPAHIDLALTTQEDDWIRLTVQDDGVGIEVTNPRRDGMGLRIMNYRARMIGGTLDVEPGAERGTVVTCQFPSPFFQPIVD